MGREKKRSSWSKVRKKNSWKRLVYKKSYKLPFFVLVQTIWGEDFVEYNIWDGSVYNRLRMDWLMDDLCWTKNPNVVSIWYMWSWLSVSPHTSCRHIYIYEFRICTRCCKWQYKYVFIWSNCRVLYVQFGVFCTWEYRSFWFVIKFYPYTT